MEGHETMRKYWKRETTVLVILLTVLVTNGRQLHPLSYIMRTPPFSRIPSKRIISIVLRRMRPPSLQ
ncbi:unnamed protein product [Spirodela intermedia]|uniref:Uncharacterized protein n=1 Tax=Spirodela intermedia TaxID=51605 RepID=A0A7I8JG70_SPIIN|nr:unnamed protein product [Spirodela intermedia]CAA6668503.1 unnamed protein product [Spirodela intermedia]